MRTRNEKNKETIAMLLDPSHYYGDSSTRIGPILAFLCAAGAPLLIYLYYALYVYIPLKFFISISAIWVIEMALIIPGKQSQRLKTYRKQLNDDYALTNDLLRIKTLHDNGLIEMLNGKCKYIVVCTNPTIENTIDHTFSIRDFQMALLDNVDDFDIDVYNDTEATLLDNRYSRINRLKDKAAAEAYVSAIDHQRGITRAHSTKAVIVYTLTVPKYDWKRLVQNVDSVINSELAKTWKSIHVANTIDEVNKYLARDINGYIDIDEMIRKKYCTNNFLGAKILGYDDFDKVVEEEDKPVSTVDFIPTYDGGGVK